MTNLYFTICSLFVSFLLLIIFLTKKNINNKETSIFKFMLLTSFLDGVCMFVIIYTAYISPDSTMVMHIFNKIDFVQYIIWASLLFLYCLYVSRPNIKNYNRILNAVKIIDLLAIVFMAVASLKIHIDGNSMYAFGISTNITYSVCACYFIALIIAIVSKPKSIFNKKFIPVVALIILGIMVFIVNKINPELLIIPAILAYIDLIMFFTIENPDVKMVEALNIAKMDAEKANRAKSDFLSSMSHEIRTPLNAIVGFSEMIENENTIEGCKENAKDIVLASHTLLDIVNGILDISKIEANKMEIVNKEYSLLPELNNLAKLMVPRIGEKPIELKTQFAEDLPSVMYGDIGKIKQVITNILTNAVKYTEKGEVNFTVNCINEKDICSLVISVEDTGRGIKPEKIDSLFTKFNRLDEDKNTTIEGTGLGLAITKSLTEMMGGKIIVQSVYGKGSKFTIYLRQKIVKQDGNIEDVKNEETETLNFEGFKVLVVDDNKLNLKVADKLLKGYSLSTVLVESGMECIDLINKGEHYDLILMDDMMPRLRGPEVLVRLKQIPGFSIPTIALTANATTGIKEGYIKEGFDDYLAKPIEKPELIRVLKKYLVKNENSTKEIKEETRKISNDSTKVLIVDDNKVNIKIAINMMKSYNFEIEEALSGNECIEKVKNKKYDLIFMDYMMPEMDGIETLKHLKELPNFHTTLIALTADAVDGSREKFLNAGFDEYVSKPINKDKLDEVISKMLNKNVTTRKEENTNMQGNVDYLKQNGIDVDHGLELLGDMDMYNETLKMFMEEINERFSKIQTFKETSDMPNYAIEVHALKSDSKYLGFMKLAEIAYDHEMKSKANDVEFVNANYNELVTETKKIFDIVKKYFN